MNGIQIRSGSWSTYDSQRPNDGTNGWGFRGLPHRYAHQQAIGNSQVFARAQCDAQNAHGTLYKTRVGLDTPRDVVFSNDHFGSILALNGATHGLRKEQRFGTFASVASLQ